MVYLGVCVVCANRLRPAGNLLVGKLLAPYSPMPMCLIRTWPGCILQSFQEWYHCQPCCAGPIPRCRMHLAFYRRCWPAAHLTANTDVTHAATPPRSHQPASQQYDRCHRQTGSQVVGGVRCGADLHPHAGGVTRARHPCLRGRTDAEAAQSLHHADLGSPAPHVPPRGRRQGGMSALRQTIQLAPCSSIMTNMTTDSGRIECLPMLTTDCSAIASHQLVQPIHVACGSKPASS